MDETLLNDEHEICEQNIAAIVRAREEFGVRFVPATGRGYLSIQQDLRALALSEQPGEYVISFNGAALTENKGNTLLRFDGIGFAKMKAIFDYGLGLDVCIRVYTRDQVFVFNLSDSEAIRIRDQKFPCVIMDVNNVDFLREVPIAKIIYQNMDMDYLKGIESALEPALKEGCTITYSSNRYMEFNASGIDKGEGLIHLCAALGVDLKDTIAVGDNYNDLPMLKVAGLSVAANNAGDDIKSVCDYTTRADNNQGVLAEVMETFIFNARG
jgi:hypothetical protein